MSILILFVPAIFADAAGGVCVAGRLKGKPPPSPASRPAARSDATKSLPAAVGARAETAWTGGGVLMTGGWNGRVCTGGVGCWRLALDLSKSARFVDLSNAATSGRCRAF
jgi:hypothetical protein